MSVYLISDVEQTPASGNAENKLETTACQAHAPPLILLREADVATLSGNQVQLFELRDTDDGNYQLIGHHPGIARPIRLQLIPRALRSKPEREDLNLSHDIGTKEGWLVN